MAIKTLVDFYSSMRKLHDIRSKIVSAIINEEGIDVTNLKTLEHIKLELEDIPKKKNQFKLKTGLGKSILLELDYELGELKKDNIFLKYGRDALKDHLQKENPSFNEDVEKGLVFLKKRDYKHFVTDRDGTVSNYCGRYQSSIQPIYNALCLLQFQKSIPGRSIILTSAPLFNIGLADISVQPEGNYILAGSKGREMLLDGETQTYPIEPEQQQKLDTLNQAIENLLKRQKYGLFRYIGSGLQYKFGQTTLARQDKNNSISEKKSLKLKKKIEKIIKDLDPNADYFSLEDTGKDLEIMLNIKSDKNSAEEFDKGHGLKFIYNHLNENISNEHVLVCGDTSSDVPLISAAQELGAKVTTVFVTEDEELKKRVKNLCNNAFFVSSPDILIYILFKYSKNQNSWNPISLFL